MSYNNPFEDETLGYRQVAEVELSEPDYSFDTLVVLEKDGGLYLATDSGCSCPTPFESHTEQDLTGPLTVDQAIEEATSLWLSGNEYYDYDSMEYVKGETGYDPKAFERFKERIREAV